MEKKFIVLICLTLLFAAEARAEVDEDIRAFVNNLENAVNGMSTYKYVIEAENRRGRKREYKISRMRFKKPNLIRLDVLKGRKRGSTVVLNKEGKIRGKNSFGIRMTLKPADRRLRNVRGDTFLNASLLDKASRIKEQILVKGYSATVEEVDWEGRASYHMRIINDDENDPVTREDIWFDKKTYFTLKNIKLEGDIVGADVTWLESEINIQIDDKIFDL